MRAVALFDLDGTLIDSRPAVLAAYRLAADEFEGGPAVLARISEGDLLAMRVVESGALIAGPDDAEAFVTAYDQAYRLRTSHLVKIYPGVVELLRGLRDDGVPLGIVTNKGASRTPADIANLDGEGNGADLFQVVVVADDSVERKPSPVPIEIAMKRGEWDPAASVYVGDGPHDADSAWGAGLAFIGAGWGYYEGKLAGHVGAKHVCDHVEDLGAAIRRALDERASEFS